MAQTQEVPQFVDRLFYGPGFEVAGVPGLAVKFGIERRAREMTRDAAPGIGQAKNEVEIGHREVRPGDPQDHLFPLRAGGGQGRRKGSPGYWPAPSGRSRERQVPFDADGRAQFPG